MIGAASLAAVAQNAPAKQVTMRARGYSLRADKVYVPPASRRPKGGTEIHAIGNVSLSMEQGSATASRVEFVVGSSNQQLQRATASGDVRFTAKLKAPQDPSGVQPTASVWAGSYSFTRPQNLSTLEGGVRVEARLADGSLLTGSAQRMTLNHSTNDARFTGNVDVRSLDAASKQEIWSVVNSQEVTVNLSTGEMVFTPPAGQQVQASVTTQRAKKEQR